MPLAIMRQCRDALGSDYPIGVKINSADFQRGGFDEGEAMEFVKMLEAASVDLIEVSGGTYEKLAMTDGPERESTKQREASFLEFSQKLVEATKVPVMCTGGWRSRNAMLEALESKATHLIGIGRPTIEADLARKLAENTVTGALITAPLEGIANFAWCQVQFDRIAMGLEPDVELKTGAY